MADVEIPKSLKTNTLTKIYTPQLIKFNGYQQAPRMIVPAFTNSTRDMLRDNVKAKRAQRAKSSLLRLKNAVPFVPPRAKTPTY